MMGMRKGMAAVLALLLMSAAGCGAAESSEQTARVAPPVTVAQARAEHTRTYRAPEHAPVTTAVTEAPVQTDAPAQTAPPRRTTAALPAETTAPAPEETTAPPPAETQPPRTARQEAVKTTAAPAPDPEPVPETKPATKPAPKPEPEPEPDPEPDPEPEDTVTAPAYAAQVLALVNQERDANGLAPLQLHPELMEAAQIRAEEVTRVFSHNRPDGSSCFTVLDDCDLFFLSAGENIAQGYVSPQEVVAGWMRSPGHRANILSDSFSMLGVGYDSASQSWVQIFVG